MSADEGRVSSSKDDIEVAMTPSMTGRVPSPEERVQTPCPECFPWRPDARVAYRCGKHSAGRVASGVNRSGDPLTGGWQYGVMYRDGSVSRRWNGNTQEKRAREEAARYETDYPGNNDGVKVVRRFIGPWEEA